MRNQKKFSRDVIELSIEETQHVAQLAKLKLTSDELETYRKQLSGILDLVGKLKNVNTKGVEATNQVTQLENIFREDVVEKDRTLSPEEVLSGAKRKHKGYFMVDAIFEE